MIYATDRAGYFHDIIERDVVYEMLKAGISADSGALPPDVPVAKIIPIARA